jgi:histidinol-phosphate aminotransferase
MKLNPVLERLTAYKAGPPLASIRERYGLDRLVLLSANEFGEGPFPEVAGVLTAAISTLNRYPDGACSDVKTMLSGLLHVPEDNLVFGNGSCEVLMLLGEAFLGPDRHVVFPQPSFVMYKAIATARGAHFTPAELPGFAYDLDRMLSAIRPDTTLIIVCNPNNPTGDYLAPAELRRLLGQVPDDVLVVVDEAYGEFVTDAAYEDTASWVLDHPNLIVLRTFSKIYGLAGLRIGYGIGAPEVIQALDKIRQPFNVDSLAQLAAAESLRHPERMWERREHVDRERRRMRGSLRNLGIDVLPSEANFLLVNVEQLAVAGEEVGQALLENGVLTRSGYAMGCPGWIRVTIGTVAENDRFLGLMSDLCRQESAHPVSHTPGEPDADDLSPES